MTLRKLKPQYGLEVLEFDREFSELNAYHISESLKRAVDGKSVIACHQLEGDRYLLSSYHILNSTVNLILHHTKGWNYKDPSGIRDLTITIASEQALYRDQSLRKLEEITCFDLKPREDEENGK